MLATWLTAGQLRASSDTDCKRRSLSIVDVGSLSKTSSLAQRGDLDPTSHPVAIVLATYFKSATNLRLHWTCTSPV